MGMIYINTAWVSQPNLRSALPEVFCKIGGLENFAKFTGKYLCQSLFCNKVAGLSLRPATLLKKRLWHTCFPVNFAKLLRTFFLWNTSGWYFWNLLHLSKKPMIYYSPKTNLFLTQRFSYDLSEYFFLRKSNELSTKPFLDQNFLQ